MIDTSENESHMEMLAANQRAFQMMMEGFEQIQNIIQAHDQLTVEKDANAEIVQTTQDNLIKDRKGRILIISSYFRYASHCSAVWGRKWAVGGFGTPLT